MIPHFDPRAEDGIINNTAQLLSGYDDPTWARLQNNRRRTYIRAAQSLMFSWDAIVDVHDRYVQNRAPLNRAIERK